MWSTSRHTRLVCITNCLSVFSFIHSFSNGASPSPMIKSLMPAGKTMPSQHVNDSAHTVKTFVEGAIHHHRVKDPRTMVVQHTLLLHSFVQTGLRVLYRTLHSVTHRRQVRVALDERLEQVFSGEQTVHRVSVHGLLTSAPRPRQQQRQRTP